MTAYDKPAVYSSILTGNTIGATHLTDLYDHLYNTIFNGGITADQLAAGAVGESALGSNAVSTVKIQDAAITEAKLADGAVTADKLDANAVNVSTFGGAFFGSWQDQDSGSSALAAGTTYKAAGDGFLTVATLNDGSPSTVDLYSHTTQSEVDSETTAARRMSGGYPNSGSGTHRNGGMCPVKKDDYVRVTVSSGTTAQLSWIPLGGNHSLIKQ